MTYRLPRRTAVYDISACACRVVACTERPRRHRAVHPRRAVAPAPTSPNADGDRAHPGFPRPPGRGRAGRAARRARDAQRRRKVQHWTGGTRAGERRKTARTQQLGPTATRRKRGRGYTRRSPAAPWTHAPQHRGQGQTRPQETPARKSGATQGRAPSGPLYFATRRAHAHLCAGPTGHCAGCPASSPVTTWPWPRRRARPTRTRPS